MIEETLAEAGEKMDKAIVALQNEFANIRTGRANPSLFASINVEYYGTPTPLQQLASFQTPEARTILITPYDKSALKAIEDALRNSDLGANPANDGNVIRIVMPEMTQERRREYIKLVGNKAEEARISVRNIRRTAKTAIDKFVKDGDIGEDDGARGEKDLDALTKKHINQIDDLFKRKEAELLEV